MSGHEFVTGFDQFVQGAVVDGRAPLLTEFFVSVTDIGSVAFMVALVIGLWLLRKRDTAVLGALGIVLAGGATKLMKELIQRSRPETSDQVVNHVSQYAFPSGHATLAFVMAVILAGTVQSRSMKLYLYLLAGIVALSRVYLGVHFLTDIVAGAVIGIFVGFFIRQHREWIIEIIEHYTGLNLDANRTEPALELK